MYTCMPLRGKGVAVRSPEVFHSKGVAGGRRTVLVGGLDDVLRNGTAVVGPLPGAYTMVGKVPKPPADPAVVPVAEQGGKDPGAFF